MKKLHDQAGFSAVEVILVLVILATVGFIGSYVYMANSKATDSYDAASESSSTPAVTSKKATASTSTTTATPSKDDAALKAAATSSDPTTTSSTADMNDADSSLTSY
jgi:prepilin-type N-terminal cleavage/methylation domain-containing protein